MTDEQKEFKKRGITARKYDGDDYYSWAVFEFGRVRMTGLSRAEVPHYKRQVLEMAKEREGKKI
jgi:hypothetical protein